MGGFCYTIAWVVVWNTYLTLHGTTEGKIIDTTGWVRKIMKRLSEDIVRTLPSDHVLLVFYRWITWVFAGLVVLVRAETFSQPSGVLFVLLLLTGSATLLLTRFSSDYVKLVRERPSLLVLDFLAGLMVVWGSGGQALPFLPYALGTLVMPIWWFVEAVVQRMRQATPDVSTPVTLPGTATDDLHSPSSSPQTSPAIRSSSDHDPQPSIPSPLDPPPTPRSVTAPPPTMLPTHHVPNRRIPNMTMDTALESADNADLFAAINGIVSQFRTKSDLRTHLDLSGAVQTLSPAKTMMLVRLAHEALLNVEQHAHAHDAWLTLHYDTDTQSICLTISDDGVGLVDGTYQRPGVHALRAISYRLSEFDGNLEVFESERGGVTVRGILPLDENQG